MPEGTVFVIRGQVIGDLTVEEHPINGGAAEALILHLDHAEIQDPPGALKLIRPIRDVMNIRSSPIIGNNIVGKLTGATEAISEMPPTATGDIWVKIGYRQFVARIYQGTEYCIYG